MFKLTTLSLLSAALLAWPGLSRAQDATAKAPATSSETAPAKVKSKVFHGKVGSIDANALTLTVGKRTFKITAGTKITKDGAPAVLSDGVAGETVSGAYKADSEGALEATTVHFGKASKKKTSDTNQ